MSNPRVVSAGLALDPRMRGVVGLAGATASRVPSRQLATRASAGARGTEKALALDPEYAPRSQLLYHTSIHRDLRGAASHRARAGAGAANPTFCASPAHMADARAMTAIAREYQIAATR